MVFTNGDYSMLQEKFIRPSNIQIRKKCPVNLNYSAVCVAKDCKGGGCSQFMGRYESELILK